MSVLRSSSEQLLQQLTWPQTVEDVPQLRESSEAGVQRSQHNPKQPVKPCCGKQTQLIRSRVTREAVLAMRDITAPQLAGAYMPSSNPRLSLAVCVSRVLLADCVQQGCHVPVHAPTNPSPSAWTDQLWGLLVLPYQSGSACTLTALAGYGEACARSAHVSLPQSCTMGAKLYCRCAAMRCCVAVAERFKRATMRIVLLRQCQNNGLTSVTETVADAVLAYGVIVLLAMIAADKVLLLASL